MNDQGLRTAAEPQDHDIPESSAASVSAYKAKLANIAAKRPS